MRGILNRSGLMISLAFGLTVALVQCGSAVPVQELTEARTQIDAAAADQAPRLASEQYNAARAALLEAHQKLSDDDYKTAQAKAEEAASLALGARAVAAPQSAAERRAAAEQAIAAADRAYAEALAPNDFAAAQSLFQDGDQLKQNAESAAASGEQPNVSSIETFSQASRKYQDSASAAERARGAALAQKQDILDSLASVRQTLERAEAWGAGEDNAEQLAQAKERLAQAESQINNDELKAGSESLKQAEQMAQNLAAAAAENYSGRRLQEAERAVAGAQRNYGLINTPANQRNGESAQQLQTINEQVAAAGEALGSARQNQSDRKFEESIRDSDEAIRLSEIVFEQAALLSGRGRQANLSEPTPTQTTTQTTADGRSYTVQRRRPADCLSCIARRRSIYGNARLWRRIYQANRETIGENPNLILPGQVLSIPPKRGPITPQKPAEEQEQKPAEQPAEQQPAEQMNENSTPDQPMQPAEGEPMQNEGEGDENMQ